MNDMSNRRVSARQKSFLQGRIYFNNRRSTVECLIRDLSASGAKLRYSDAVVVPDLIELYILAKDETYRGRIQWRQGDEVGVAFILDEAASPAPESSDPGGDIVTRLKQLEADVAALQRVVKTLQVDLRRRQGSF